MVGHARAHTIATLLASEKERDQKLLQQVMNHEESKISRATLEEQLKRGRELDQLTGGISNSKIKEMPKEKIQLLTQD